MIMFGIVFTLMVLAVSAMAVGVIAGRKSLQGSCGGLETIQGIDCMVCPTPCESEEQKEQCHQQHESISPSKFDSIHMVQDSCPKKKLLTTQPLAKEGVLWS